MLKHTLHLIGAASLVALTTTASAEIKLNDNISVSGFLDMSASFNAPDPGENSNDIGFDQGEIDFALKYAPLTANIDLDYLRSSSEFRLAQGYVTYALDESKSFTAGRFLSYMGYEGDEPTKLYQYSYAYAFGVPYAGYNDGVKFDVTSGKASYGIAFVSANYGRDSRATDEFGIELKTSVAISDAWTVFAGYSFDKKQQPGVDDVSYYNLWTQYKKDSLTFAAEIGYLDDDTAFVLPQHYFWLVMANYAVTPKYAITGRISGQMLDLDSSAEPSNTKFTLSPSYKLHDNLLLVGEVAYTTFSDISNVDSAISGAVELLFTF